MTIRGWKKYVPLWTPAAKDLDDRKVDNNLLAIKILLVSLAAIGVSLAASYAKVNLRKIVKFVAPPTVCIVIGEILRTLYATSEASCAINVKRSFYAIYPSKELDRIMLLPEGERREAIYNQIAFSPDLWASCLTSPKILEDVNLARESLPSNIVEILNSPCPVIQGQRVADTHMLVWIPKSLGGEISINSLDELLKHHLPNDMSSPPLNSLGEIRTSTIEKSYWALVLNDLVPHGYPLSYEAQKNIVSALNREHPYEVLSVIEVLTCILAEYVRSNRFLYGYANVRVQRVVKVDNKELPLYVCNNPNVGVSIREEGIYREVFHESCVGAVRRFGL